MARIRTIKPEFFTSEQIVECSTNARLLFIGMWCFCDDQGIHPASIKTLKMEIFPGDDIGDKQITEYVNQLKENKLLTEYTVDNKDYWIVTGWKHQRIDRPNPRHPLPEHSTNVPRLIVEQSPPEGKGKESKGKESKGKNIIYAFSGKIIKLTQKDYDNWQKAFNSIPDFTSELTALDIYYSGLTKNELGNWFARTSQALNKRNQEYSTKGKPKSLVGKDDPFGAGYS